MLVFFILFNRTLFMSLYEMNLCNIVLRIYRQAIGSFLSTPAWIKLPSAHVCASLYPCYSSRNTRQNTHSKRKTKSVVIENRPPSSSNLYRSCVAINATVFIRV